MSKKTVELTARPHPELGAAGGLAYGPLVPVDIRGNIINRPGILIKERR